MRLADAPRSDGRASTRPVRRVWAARVLRATPCGTPAVGVLAALCSDPEGLMTDLDLVDQLAEAAADAVRARRGAIEAAGSGALSGIVVEIETANRGQVIDVTSYLTWKQTVR